MSKSHILFERVSFYYDTLGEPVFSNLSLCIHLGFTGIVGPNGAGKSTLLRLITGELSPQEGKIKAPNSLYCPQRTDDLPEACRNGMNLSASVDGKHCIDSSSPRAWRANSFTMSIETFMQATDHEASRF